jgi:hypothetical protein
MEDMDTFFHQSKLLLNESKAIRLEIFPVLPDHFEHCVKATVAFLVNPVEINQQKPGVGINHEYYLPKQPVFWKYYSFGHPGLKLKFRWDHTDSIIPYWLQHTKKSTQMIGQNEDSSL